MPRDYAKQIPTRPPNTNKNRPSTTRPSLRTGGLIIAILVIIVITATWIYLYGPAIKSNTHKAKKNPPAQVKKAEPITKPAVPQALQPKFDFYTILPQQKVTLPPTKPQTKPKQPVATNHYNLQITSVTTLEAADQLKAQLALLGYNVFVQTAKQNNQTRYRVNVGPYTSKTQAQADQKRLSDNKISSQLIAANIGHH